MNDIFEKFAQVMNESVDFQRAGEGVMSLLRTIKLVCFIIDRVGKI